MKTEVLLNLKAPGELSAALDSMNTEGREQHVRKLAEMLKLGYEESIGQVASIISEAGVSDETSILVSKHFLELGNQSFKSEDDDFLLKRSSPHNDPESGLAPDELDLSPAEERELAARNLKLAEGELELIRMKRALAVSLFTILVFSILPTRASIIQDT